MTLFFQYLVSGLATGSIYALVALGLALIYRSTRILNFAHGDITTAGTFMAFTLLSLNLPFALAFVIAIVFGSVLAMAFYFCVLVPAQRREATQLGQIILTLGLGLILQGLVAYFGGTVPQAFPFPLSDIKIYHLGEVVVSQLSLGTFFISLFAFCWCKKRASAWPCAPLLKIFPPPRQWAFPPARFWPLAGDWLPCWA
jgi:branched-chain amino acid transport system permease protein